jgi:hypothetical protein
MPSSSDGVESDGVGDWASEAMVWVPMGMGIKGVGVVKEGGVVVGMGVTHTKGWAARSRSSMRRRGRRPSARVR